MSAEGKAALDRAFKAFEEELPAGRITRAMRWLRGPKAKWVRIPVGILCLIGGCLWFLPILGAWMLPLGLMLIAEDVPFLQKPMSKLILWMVQKWRDFKEWRTHRRRSRAQKRRWREEQTL